jgi:hypothetical protein
MSTSSLVSKKDAAGTQADYSCPKWTQANIEREVVTSNDKPRIVAHRYIIEASIDKS